MSENQPLNELERAILDKLLTGDPPLLAALREQIESCRVATRRFTGFGFFTHFAIDRSIESAQVSEPQTQILYVGAEIKGLERGASFVLFVKNGYLDFLEGFTYDEPWPSRLSILSLYYEGPRAIDRNAFGPGANE